MSRALVADEESDKIVRRAGRTVARRLESFRKLEARRPGERWPSMSVLRLNEPILRQVTLANGMDSVPIASMTFDLNERDAAASAAALEQFRRLGFAERMDDADYAIPRVEHVTAGVWPSQGLLFGPDSMRLFFERFVEPDLGWFRSLPFMGVIPLLIGNGISSLDSSDFQLDWKNGDIIAGAVACVKVS